MLYACVKPIKGNYSEPPDNSLPYSCHNQTIFHLILPIQCPILFLGVCFAFVLPSLYNCILPNTAQEFSCLSCLLETSEILFPLASSRCTSRLKSQQEKQSQRQCRPATSVSSSSPLKFLYLTQCCCRLGFLPLRFSLKCKNFVLHYNIYYLWCLKLC